MRKLILIAAAAFGLAVAAPAHAQQGNYEPFTQPSGAQVPAFVMLCAGGTDRVAVPCGAKVSPFWVMSMPFTRLHRDPIQLLDLGPVPKSFPINRPDAATTYRIVVLCNVPIRIMGAMSASEQVSGSTGTAYLPLTETTMGTSKPLFISAMTIGTPDGACSADMHYGVGGG